MPIKQRETFIDIPGYEGLYQVSDFGRVKSVLRLVPSGRRECWYLGKTLAPTPNTKGYLRVTLSKDSHAKTFMVHRLVLVAFSGSQPRNMEANHKNGERADNRLENLEWLGHADNMRHSYTVLGRKRLIGNSNRNAKMTWGKVDTIREMYDSGVPRHEIAHRFELSFSCIDAIVTNRTWKKERKCQ